MQVEIWSDLVCPWCYIGQARLRQALAGFEHRGQVAVVHRSFELDPGFPKGETTTVLEMLAGKYGITGDQAQAAEQRVAGLAAAEGLPLRAGRPHGNTFDAHRLLQLARDRGCQQTVLDALYRTHFGGEASIFDTATLVTVAAAAGLDPGETGQVLASGDYGDAVRGDERRARELGVTGVPFAVAGGRLAVSGAQPAEVFTRLLATAWQDGSSAAS